MITKVIQFKKNIAPLDPTAETDAILEQVRRECYDYHPDELAEKCEVSYSTIMSFRSGRTKWPRPKTLLPILRVLGYRIDIVKTRNRK